MRNMREKGVCPRLSQSAQRFKRKSNKKPRGRVIAAHKSSLEIKRVVCSKFPPKSGARLYCELTSGKYPVVARKGAQFRLGRQGVGLVPLPEVGAQSCMMCYTTNSVAHTAFECPAQSQPRKEALEALDRVCPGLGLSDDHQWWPLPKDQKLRAPVCPKGGVVPLQKEEAFFSQAASAGENFYEGSSRTACPTPDT